MKKRMFVLLVTICCLVACQTAEPVQEPTAVVTATHTAIAPTATVELPTATALPTETVAAPTETPAAETWPTQVQAAVAAALAQVREAYPQQAPAADLSWQATAIDQQGMVGAAGYRAQADGWHLEITYPIVAPNLTIYRLALDHPDSGFSWRGEVNAKGQVAELRNAPIPVTGEQVEGLIGTVHTLPPMAQFDDYFQVQGDAERYGIDAADPELAAQIQSLRDSGQALRVWGVLEREAMDVNGVQLHLTRIELVELPPTVVDGWQGVIMAPQPGSQFGDYFLLDDGQRLDIGSTDPAIQSQIAAFRASGEVVQVWGELLTGVPATEARHINVTRIELAEPTDPDAQAFEGWVGVIRKLPPGNQHGQLFERQDGESFNLGATRDEVWEQVRQATWTGAQVRLSGHVYDMSRHIEVEVIEVLTERAAEARNLAPFAVASASSHLASDRYGAYGPVSAIDGWLSTPWVEGVDGSGVGEWIRLQFPEPVRITRLGLDVGYDRDEMISSVSPAFFTRNNRLKRVTITGSDGQRASWTAEDVRGVQPVSLSVLGWTTDFIQVTIEEVYPGSHYDDTCLAELEAWGWVN